MKILLSNLGYARGINGQLAQHLLHANRHLYCSPSIQQHSLRQLGALIEQENPDICCFVEIDQGSIASSGFNQLNALINEKYHFFDIESKYAPASILRSFFITKGKSNAFIAKRFFSYEKLYFKCGTKRLIYKIQIREDLILFFAHFSLNKSVRQRQLIEAGILMSSANHETMFLGDFNILSGASELEPLLRYGPFTLLNRENQPTFTFHKHRLMLDLCICSANISKHTDLKIIPQSYSDHDALLVEIRWPP
jgi:endonuclease/exonuclease/phosphatase family metal-dependent hydrolase